MESSTKEDNDKQMGMMIMIIIRVMKKRFEYKIMSIFRKWVDNVESGLTFKYKNTVLDSGLDGLGSSYFRSHCVMLIARR